MKKNTSIVLLGTALAVTLIMWGFNGISATPFLVAGSAKDPTEHAAFLGHVTYVVKDKNGNIKSYLQSDNLVAQRGKNCAVNELFYNMSKLAGGVGPCAASTGQGLNVGNSGFNWIGIGNGTTALTDADTALSQAAGHGEVQPRIQGTVTFTAATAGNPAVATIATPVATPFKFTELSATNPLTESGLFNLPGVIATGGKVASSAIGDLFAEQAINVSVNPSDSLGVTWTINIG